MDREGIISKRNDDGDEAILGLTSTGKSSEVLPSSANEVGGGNRKIKSALSKGVEAPSLLTPGERKGDELEGGQRRSMSFRLSGRQYSKDTNKVKRESGKGKKDGFGEKRGAMMVVSVLIATLTYQAALNPPGGFWQDDQNGSAATPAHPSNGKPIPPTAYITSEGSSDVHEAGTAINRNFHKFQAFMIANTVGLFASLVVILLLTSAITIKQQIMMWLLMFIMWVSVFSVSFSFCMGAVTILRGTGHPAVTYLSAFVISSDVLLALLVILHLGVGLRKMYRRAKKKRSHGEEVLPSASLSVSRDKVRRLTRMAASSVLL